MSFPRRRVARIPSTPLWIEPLEDRLAPAVFFVADGDTAGFVTAVAVANATPEADTIQLAAGGLYQFAGADNFWYGPNALPAISSAITVEGNGATLDRLSTGMTTADGLRFFYVSGGLSGLAAGSLTLRNLTLQDGLAKGGDSGGFGGGGMGAGGAIFCQGALVMDGVTLTGNTARGGDAGTEGPTGGGGIGQDAQGGNGGGFGGAFPFGTGGAGGVGADGGGGGGGFAANGGAANGAFGGAGGGFSRLGGTGGLGPFNGGGGGDGGGGGGGFMNGGGAAGGGFGLGGFLGSGDSAGAGGGGIGGGGGTSGGLGGGGGGGFGGGGGGSNLAGGGGGGFGGGGGAGGGISLGGFGGGNGGGLGGGGGGGLGGALFIHLGNVSMVNCTLAFNTVTGGFGLAGGGSAFGGGIFNLNGVLTLRNSTIANNSAAGGLGNQSGFADGGAVYSLAYGNSIAAANAPVSATVNLINSILADSTYIGLNGSHELVNERHADATTGSQATLNLVTVRSIVESFANNGGTIINAGPGDANILAVDPVLDPLGLRDNGGPTRTIALAGGSPAIDAGIAAISTGTDERGVVRDALPDLGAFEFVGGLLAAGADSGVLPQVKVYANASTLRFSLSPYPGTFLGGVRVAVGDVTGDGVADIITAPGKGLARATIKVFDGNTGQQVATVNPFPAMFKGGAYIAAGDFDGDAAEEVVVGMGSAGGQVRIFNIDGGTASQVAGPLGNFKPYGATFLGGVTVAAGNFDNTGVDEVVTGKAKGPAQVRVFADENGARVRRANFLAYGAPFAGGVFVSAGDLNGDGLFEIVTGPGAGTAAEMKFFEGDGTPVPFVLPVYPGFTGGVRVALLDLNHDGTVDRIAAAPGKGQALEVKLFDLTPVVVDSFFAFDPLFTGGVFVGA